VESHRARRGERVVAREYPEERRIRIRGRGRGTEVKSRRGIYIYIYIYVHIYIYTGRARLGNNDKCIEVFSRN